MFGAKSRGLDRDVSCSVHVTWHARPCLMMMQRGLLYLHTEQGTYRMEGQGGSWALRLCSMQHTHATCEVSSSWWGTSCPAKVGQVLLARCTAAAQRGVAAFPDRCCRDRAGSCGHTVWNATRTPTMCMVPVWRVNAEGGTWTNVGWSVRGSSWGASSSSPCSTTNTQQPAVYLRMPAQPPLGALPYRTLGRTFRYISNTQ